MAIIDLSGIPLNKLRASALFASRDSDRARLCGVLVERLSDSSLLFVSTDGRRIGVIKHDVSRYLVPEFEPFTIPIGIIDDAGWWNDVRAAVAAAERAEMPFDAGVQLWPAVSIILNTETRRVDIFSRDASRGTTGCAVAGPFPNWRAAIRKEAFTKGEPQYVSCFNGDMFADFSRAAQYLVKPVHALVAESIAGGAVFVRMHAYPDFFGALMPVRNDEGETGRPPEWLVLGEPPAPPACAEKETVLNIGSFDGAAI